MTLSVFEIVIIAALLGILLIGTIIGWLLYFAAMAENADLRRRHNLFTISSPRSKEAR